MKVILVNVARFAGVAVILLACGNKATPTGAATGATCSNDYSGTWSLDGTCADKSCVMTQTGCNLEVSARYFFSRSIDAELMQ